MVGAHRLERRGVVDLRTQRGGGLVILFVKGAIAPRLGDLVTTTDRNISEIKKLDLPRHRRKLLRHRKGADKLDAGVDLLGRFRQIHPVRAYRLDRVAGIEVETTTLIRISAGYSRRSGWTSSRRSRSRNHRTGTETHPGEGPEVEGRSTHFLDSLGLEQGRRRIELAGGDVQTCRRDRPVIR
jgi:hypothetical protein